jgi:PqqD family protein of HPr-rel-A system
MLPGEITDRPRPYPDLTVCPLDGELVVYQPRSRRGYVLNASAAQIWSLCDGSRSVRAVADQMATDFGLDARRALADVQACLEALQQTGLLCP